MSEVAAFEFEGVVAGCGNAAVLHSAGAKVHPMTRQRRESGGDLADLAARGVPIHRHVFSACGCDTHCQQRVLRQSSRDRRRAALADSVPSGNDTGIGAAVDGAQPAPAPASERDGKPRCVHLHGCRLELQICMRCSRICSRAGQHTGFAKDLRSDAAALLSKLAVRHAFFWNPLHRGITPWRNRSGYQADRQRLRRWTQSDSSTPAR